MEVNKQKSEFLEDEMYAQQTHVSAFFFYLVFQILLKFSPNLTNLFF